MNQPATSHAATCSDAQLIVRVGQRDREAFVELYDRFSRPLFSFAFRVLNDQKDAEDVLQDVFLQIWHKADAFSTVRGTPFGWAVSMTRNKAIDHLRSKRRRMQLFTETTTIEILENATLEATRNFDADQNAEIRSSIDDLPHPQRQAIEMAFFSGLTHLEIAGQLQTPLGTIKARIRRGMLTLRELVER